jgi:putative peptide zinc metalloprotease protein
MSLPVASIDRPLNLRLRPDLIAVPVEMSGCTTWLVKDPATLEHFQFSAEEYALVNWLRHSVSIAELRRRFAAQFPPQTISPQAVWDFLSRLHGAGLLIGDGVGQGCELLRRMRRDRARRWALSWTTLLAIRFRGVDPDAFLTAAHRRLSWLFSPATLLAALVVVLYAASLVMGHFDEFRQRLPELSALLDARNLPWLLIAIGAVKVLHELGHALACKHLGGEVRELGLMLLVFAPCLYCDVSDAWRLKSKWQRIAVSAAGMLAEILLAALAAIVWWHAQPGVTQLVAMNTMIVCTIGTLMVNGNPLLRYDGYYILSDLVETPNLWRRSREVLRRFATCWLLGEPRADDDPLVPLRHRTWLAAYAAASKCYLAVVCVAIVWGLVELLYPLHLEILAYAVGLTVLGSALVGPSSGLLRLVHNPIRRAELRTGRLALVTSIGLAGSVAVLAFPVNYYVRAPLVLMPDDAARIYATVDGTLESILTAGSRVERGATIGRLDNMEVKREVARIEGEWRLRTMRVAHLESLRGFDSYASDQLPAARAARDDAKRRLVDRQRDAARLKLTAPADGVVMTAPMRSPSSERATQLATWTGSLLEKANLGAYVEAGTLVCLVGNPERFTAVLLVDDTDVKRLRPGQIARLCIDQLPGHVLKGEIIDVARHEVRDETNQSNVQADLTPLYAGVLPPGRRGAIYQARVRFEAPPQTLVIGGRGSAKVAAERITLARSIARLLGRTFRLPI